MIINIIGTEAEKHAQIKKYIPISNSFSSSNIQGYITESIQDFVIPAFSEEFFQEINTNTNNYPEPFLDMLSRAILNFAYSKFIATGSQHITNDGVMTFVGDKLRSVSPEATQQAQKNFSDVGHKEIDKCLIFLEKNMVLPSGGINPLYKKWEESTAFTINYFGLINNASDFNSHVNINNSRRVFLKLKPSIFLVENHKIKSILGEPLYKKLLETTSGHAVMTSLLHINVLPALAHLSIAHAIPQLVANLGRYDTVSLFDNTGSGNQKGYKTADKETLDWLIRNYEEKGDKYLSTIIPTILANKTTFQDYYTFNDVTKGVSPQFENKKENRLFLW